MSDSWMNSPPRRHGIDAMQVCLNGHKITDAAEQMPEQQEAYCSTCGAKTIMSCAVCNAKIPGINWDSGGVFSGATPPPDYCLACGSAYPWQQACIANAIEVLEETISDQADLEIAKAALPELIAGSPKTEVAVLRMKRVLAKAGKPAYDIGIKVISDLVSETVKKTLLKP